MSTNESVKRKGNPGNNKDSEVAESKKGNK